MAAHDPVPVEDIDYEVLPPNFTAWENMLAGGFAGVAEHSVMYPVDMLKTRLQVLKPAEGGLYTGMHQAFWKIRRIEGFRSMWKGVSSVIVGAGMLCVLLRGAQSNDVMKVRRMPSTF